jgi:hypothetical protein
MCVRNYFLFFVLRCKYKMGRKRKAQRGGFGWGDVGDFGKGFGQGFFGTAKVLDNAGVSGILKTTPYTAPAGEFLSTTANIGGQLGYGRRRVGRGGRSK